MPRHRSPFDEWVFNEWLPLTSIAEKLLSEAEQRSGWEALFARTYIQGKWRCNADSASLVTSLGVTQALIDGRYGDAEQLARLFLSMDPTACDPVYWNWHWVKLGVAVLLQGRVDEAIDHWNAYQPTRKSDTRLLAFHLRTDLLDCLHSMGSEHNCESRLRQFVSQLVSQLTKRKGVAVRALRATTNAELMAALTETFPKRPNESPSNGDEAGPNAPAQAE